MAGCWGIAGQMVICPKDSTVHTYGVSAGIWIWIFGGTVLYVLEILDQDSEPIQGRQALFKFVNDGFREWTVEWATTSQLEGNCRKSVLPLVWYVRTRANRVHTRHSVRVPSKGERVKGANALVPGHWPLEL